MRLLHDRPDNEQDRARTDADYHGRRFVFPKWFAPPHTAIGAYLVAVLVVAVGVVLSVNVGWPGPNRVALAIGQTGGLLMIAFVAILSGKCIKVLGSPASEVGIGSPVAKFTVGEKCLVYFSALALQFFVLYFAFLTTEHGFYFSEFWDAFLKRFAATGDNLHYLYLAEHGYQRSGEKATLIIFYPLYPALIWFFGIFLGGYAKAALIISWVCWGAACVSMLELASQRYDRSRAALATLMLALYPFSFFSVGIYTESLFLLLSIQCLLRIERRQWIAAGVLGGLAALCRTQGILLILPAVYVWLLARKESKQDWKALFLLLIPAGFGGYLLLNKVVAGSWTAYYKYEREAPWYHIVRWISSNLIEHYQLAQQYPGLASFIYMAQLVGYFAAMALLFYGLFSGAPTHLLLYGGAYLGVSFLTSWLVAGPRYLFSCVPLFLLLARPKNKGWQILIPAVSAVMLSSYAALCMQGQSIM
jgi:Gpi18-like mannosyltransferase